MMTACRQLRPVFVLGELYMKPLQWLPFHTGKVRLGELDLKCGLNWQANIKPYVPCPHLLFYTKVRCTLYIARPPFRAVVLHWSIRISTHYELYFVLNKTKTIQSKLIKLSPRNYFFSCTDVCSIYLHPPNLLKFSIYYGRPVLALLFKPIN